MQRGSRLIYLIVLLDSMGIGIVFPTLPSLLRTLLHGSGDVARHYGLLLAAYAATLLLTSPALGMLSDRFGRRPVLLLSLAGTAFDDLVMALAPTLPILYLGRTLAGLTGANFTVANAYLADTSTEETRAVAFGRMNASFGIGFVIGPLLGGLAGMYSLRAPFFAAALLNLLGTVVCTAGLPESRPPVAERRPVRFGDLNPLGALRSIGRLQGVRGMLYVFCTMATVGQIPSVLWVIYGANRFGWTSAAVGFSFALFGLLHALCQVFLPGPAQEKLGRRGSILAGMTADSLAYVAFSLVRTSAAALSVIPLMSVGGIAEAAVQAELTGSVAEERQGELQGVLTSCISLVAVVGPLAVSGLYAFLRRRVPGYPGLVWLVAPLLYVPCVVFLGPATLRHLRQAWAARAAKPTL